MRKKFSSSARLSDDGGPPLLVSLLEGLPDVFEANVLPRLGIKDHVALAGVNRACRGALKEVEAVRWLLSRGEEWDKLWLQPSCRRRYEVCANAAREGQLEVLRWARDRGCEWDWLTCLYAAEGGHLEVLRWARENGCEWNSSYHERNSYIWCKAALHGHLEVLKWARANGCEWDFRTCAYAARGGHLDVLKWARENDCPWNALTCAHAAEGGHLDVLQWARANGCKWDSRTCFSAAACLRAAEGRQVLQWARENGCPG